MATNEHDDKGSTRLYEAINPEIGNGIAFESNAHALTLRMPDPGKLLESLLPPHNLPDETEITPPSDKEQVEVEIEKVKKEDRKRSKNKDKKKKNKKSHSLTGDDITPLQLVDRDEPSETTSDIPEDTIPNQPDSGADALFTSITEGKRMRKVIAISSDDTPADKEFSHPQLIESTLSPFTSWLKNLRGSEYVHPYDDDYGLDQLNSSTKDGISETFADLLAGQGYHEQAIEMYKLLMARFPEKSSFFAAKIEALK
ncbi:MAG: hypothetical protein M3R25_15550 [Bacteroidota bacterium]|nr:hypothetical protein [Bacteroidota bacterium]